MRSQLGMLVVAVSLSAALMSCRTVAKREGSEVRGLEIESEKGDFFAPYLGEHKASNPRCQFNGKEKNCDGEVPSSVIFVKDGDNVKLYYDSVNERNLIHTMAYQVKGSREDGVKLVARFYQDPGLKKVSFREEFAVYEDGEAVAGKHWSCTIDPLEGGKSRMTMFMDEYGVENGSVEVSVDLD